MPRAVYKQGAALAVACYAAHAAAVESTCAVDGSCEVEDAGAMKTVLLQRHAQGTLQAHRAAQLLNETDYLDQALSYGERMRYLSLRKRLVLQELEGCEQQALFGVGGCDAPCGRSTCRQRTQNLINNGWAVFDAVKKVDTDCIDACYCSVTDFGEANPLMDMFSPDDLQQGLDQACKFKTSICGSNEGVQPYTGPVKQCSEKDKKLMEAKGAGSGPDSFQGIIAGCARKSFDFTKGLLPQKFKDCLGASVPMSEKCMDCFVFSSSFGITNCKIGPCIKAWCSEGCAACSSPNKANVDKCIGFEPPQAPACEKPGVPAPPPPAAAAMCSDDDLAKMNKAGPGSGESNFAGIVAGCSRKAFSFTAGILADKFNGCMNEKLGLSDKCTQCFRDGALWNINNCKIGPCIQSWCSQGCLDCSTQNQAQVDKCTGKTVPKATVCT
eukprot:TRINITY_DN3020_c0_g2_i4.p1 TRINITY_DN3020_c0_g2~~TRINITY_DN3020_c0_g2_i4.p1  ORF type:complete len:440 (+),score=122.01 TRINITY_DN3020_c0_g2_i4:90-1409(+)